MVPLVADDRLSFLGDDYHDLWFALVRRVTELHAERPIRAITGDPATLPEHKGAYGAYEQVLHEAEKLLTEMRERRQPKPKEHDLHA